jgi:hypothetical protein
MEISFHHLGRERVGRREDIKGDALGGVETMLG